MHIHFQKGKEKVEKKAQKQSQQTKTQDKNFLIFNLISCKTQLISKRFEITSVVYFEWKPWLVQIRKAQYFFPQHSQ